MVPRILIVEPNPARQRQLVDAIGSTAVVDAVEDFNTARTRIVTHRPDFLAANLRLGEYNGLHLVYLAAALNLSVRSFVYTEQQDAGFATDVETAGATYDTFQSLRSTIAGHLMADAGSLDESYASHPVAHARF